MNSDFVLALSYRIERLQNSQVLQGQIWIHNKTPFINILIIMYFLNTQLLYNFLVLCQLLYSIILYVTKYKNNII